jgi:hypothetical protein
MVVFCFIDLAVPAAKRSRLVAIDTDDERQVFVVHPSIPTAIGLSRTPLTLALDVAETPFAPALHQHDTSQH